MMMLEKVPAPTPEVAKDANSFIHPITGKVMIKVPAGKFLYEVEEVKKRWFGEDEKNKVIKETYLDGFWIDKTPVTQAEYKRFIDAHPTYPVPFGHGRARPYSWDQDRRTFPVDKADHPIVLVSWHDAIAYAKWAEFQLPTEQQWEKAARGEVVQAYTWGNEWRENHCNTKETHIRDTSPVGQFSRRGDSQYGCVDMSGNVWEWTRSFYDENKTSYIVRGGSWYGYSADAVVSSFRWNYPNYPDLNYGFRLISPVVWTNAPKFL